MANFKKYTLFSIVLLTSVTEGLTQAIENVKSTFDGERMTITYDLSNSDQSQKFKVALYGSHNNYTLPIGYLTGEVGEQVLPGKSKRVVWDIQKELPPDFDADISIKVKAAKVIPPFAKMQAKPLLKTGYKRGQSVDVQWTGGKPSDKIHIDLYKDGILNQKLAENLGNGQQLYQWSLPKGLKGSGYSFAINNASEKSSSGTFKVKPKIPLLLKVLPVLVIGGVVVALGGSKSTATDSPTNDLPGPVKPN